MKPLKDKISITIDSDILEKLREIAEADEAFKALANNDGSLKKVLVEISK